MADRARYTPTRSLPGGKQTLTWTHDGKLATDTNSQIAFALGACPRGQSRPLECRAPQGGRWAAASHSTGLFFRGGQQPADAIGVRGDVLDARDAGEPGVCRHERLSSCRVGRCGQDRVERAEARSFLEQA